MEPLSLDDDTANDADVAPQNNPSSFSLEASGSRAPTPSNGSTAEADIIQDIITQDESSATNRRKANQSWRLVLILDSLTNEAIRVIAFEISDPVAGITLGNIPEVDDKILYPPTNKDENGQVRKDDESDSRANKTTIP
ncbi:hypothetical protein PoB_003787400 [Plakobranchus ocellatus]|uniref:Uncharacterized protein n=1 Tax=Plakobranchus ocellatus TaxID=259542 RepID=A0AAV4AZ24_9GAST|nr:hypothetical protein PoB_003787400 [Plakobranchus ocellatus]